jgi:hypothetical protein
MAQIKKRRAHPLTLGAIRPERNARIYGPLAAFPSASGPASQVPPLAASLAGPLAESESPGTLKSDSEKLPFSQKARGPKMPKPAYPRGFLPLVRSKCFTPQPRPLWREPGALLPRALPDLAGMPLPVKLGEPLGIREVAALIGCSPWTVRQTLVPRGIPFFRSGASGRLIFYRDQIERWIEQQQGGISTK